MTSQNEVEGIEDELRTEDVGIGSVEEVVVVTKTLYIPAGTPDIGSIGNAVRCFCALFLQLIAKALQGISYRFGEPGIVHLLLGTTHEPAHTFNVIRNEITFLQQDIPVLRFAGCQVEFGCGMQLRCFRWCRRRRPVEQFAGNRQSLDAQRIVKAIQHT